MAPHALESGHLATVEIVGTKRVAGRRTRRSPQVKRARSSSIASEKTALLLFRDRKLRSVITAKSHSARARAERFGEETSLRATPTMECAVTLAASRGGSISSCRAGTPAGPMGLPAGTRGQKNPTSRNRRRQGDSGRTRRATRYPSYAMSHSLDSASSLLASALRLGAGTKARPARRRREKLLELYEFEACPFCRRVREALSEFDLDALVFPAQRAVLASGRRRSTLGGKEASRTSSTRTTVGRCTNPRTS